MVLLPERKTSYMPNLSDTQCVLLSSAAQRDTASLLPLPASIKPGNGVTKAIGALVRRGLVEERETRDTTAKNRSDGDILYGLFLTPAGATAIGVELADAPATGQSTTTSQAVTSAPQTPSKAATVVSLMSRSDGATLPELIAATGWLPHTTRAALTGLRKKGHRIIRDKRAGVTCYYIRNDA